MTQPSIDGRPKPIYVWVAIGSAILLLVIGIGVLFVRAMTSAPPAPMSTVTVKPSTTLLVAVRDLARLETNEMHFEKVIDLTDKQSRFFGLVDTTDALLLVASGDVTMGVDLGKIGDGDVAMDDTTKVATITLPAPEIFSTRLDEKRTYVYTRSTSVLAERNETLETRARQEAVTSLEQAANTQESTDRSKKQAEIELRSLAIALGAKDVHFIWK